MKITEYKMKVHNVPPLTFAFVSDLHDYPNEPVINAVKQMKPDAILVPGDFIHDNEIYKNGIEFLRMAANIAPVFCSLGNHEMRYNGNIAELVKGTGAILLDDSSYMFKGINIGGLTTGYRFGVKQKRLGNTPKPNLEWLKSYSLQDGYKILLSHHPEYYEPYIKELPINLVLSGHAHGGQCRIFGQGLIAPGQGFFPKYTSGIYDERLIVSRGIGNQFIVPRVNNPREIIVIKINGENE